MPPRRLRSSSHRKRRLCIGSLLLDLLPQAAAVHGEPTTAAAAAAAAAAGAAASVASAAATAAHAGEAQAQSPSPLAGRAGRLHAGADDTLEEARIVDDLVVPLRDPRQVPLVQARVLADARREQALRLVLPLERGLLDKVELVAEGAQVRLRVLDGGAGDPGRRGIFGPNLDFKWVRNLPMCCRAVLQRFTKPLKI